MTAGGGRRRWLSRDRVPALLAVAVVAVNALLLPGYVAWFPLWLAIAIPVASLLIAKWLFDLADPPGIRQPAHYGLPKDLAPGVGVLAVRVTGRGSGRSGRIDLRIDGRNRSIQTSALNSVTLPAGEHTVALPAAWFGSARTPVQIDAGCVSSIEVHLGLVWPPGGRIVPPSGRPSPIESDRSGTSTAESTATDR